MDPREAEVLKKRDMAAALDRARKFLERQRQVDCPCKYGHFGCSDVDGGRCSDETLATYPELLDE